MSRPRTELMPGDGLWDEFFDKKIQRVLLRRFDDATDAKSKPARLEYLAWPIIAYLSAKGLADNRKITTEMQGDFVLVYAEDRLFVADLLAAITHFNEPKTSKSLSRRMAELWSTSSFKTVPEPNADEFDAVLIDWKSVAELLNWEKTPNHLQVEYKRERSRRGKLLIKWKAHIDAYYQLLKTRGYYGGKEPWVPLQHVSFDS